MSEAPEVFGDWRDLRGAIERSYPDWNRISEHSRTQMWEFAKGVLEEYAPLSFQCWGCKQALPIQASYRCADCHAPYCASCIRPHFGPKHRSHG